MKVDVELHATFLLCLSAYFGLPKLADICLARRDYPPWLWNLGGACGHGTLS